MEYMMFLGTLTVNNDTPLRMEQNFHGMVNGCEGDWVVRHKEDVRGKRRLKHLSTYLSTSWISWMCG